MYEKEIAQAVEHYNVRDIDDLNPIEVNSIRMLRGHEATRTYGSQGANGVVLIKTK